MLRLQYCSDLHLEFKPINQISKLLKNVDADILVLAGDISAINNHEDYLKFLFLISHYSKKYKYILHVSGNHEYYAVTKASETSISDVNKKFKALMKMYPKYIYMDCDNITLNINDKPYMFAGATLWTKVNPDDYEYVQNSMNDYSHIYTDDATFTVQSMQKIHSKHTTFLKRAIKKADETKTPLIIITHHKPVLENADAVRLNQAYEVDMSKVFVSSNIKLAIHGHTHVNYDKVINGVRYVSNPKGYVGQKCGFKKDLFIDI